MARKVSTKVAAISGISALAVTGLIAFASTNSASADDLVNPTSSTSAHDDFGHHGGKDGHMDGDHIGGKVIDRTETFVDENGVVTVHTISTGTVTAVDSNSVTYTDANGEEITATASDTTLIERDGVAATLSDIAVNDLIAVETESVDGVETVESINASSTGVLAPPHHGHGRGHHGRDGDPDGDRGQRIGSETTYEDADGNIVTEIDYDGEVTAVGNTSITITLADGSSVTVDVNDATVIEKSHADATLADIIATDLVRIDVVDGVATEIRAITAEEFANGDLRGHGPDGDKDGDMGMGGHHRGGHHGR
ncbi:MAG: hypothetical protein RL228_941 [Actinomycetota bacterium]|jgi:hypothetical protein